MSYRTDILVEKNDLIDAGLELMEKNGKPLTKSTWSTQKIGKMKNGETVRVRTCKMHGFVCNPPANKPRNEKGERKLNIEGTDWVLYIMLDTPYTPGKVRAYLLPTKELVEEFRNVHRDRLESMDDSNNNPLNLFLWNKDYEGRVTYEQKWKKYRLEGEASTGVREPVLVEEELISQEEEESEYSENSDNSIGSINTEIKTARQRIARIAGVPEEAVKVTIDFGG